MNIKSFLYKTFSTACFFLCLIVSSKAQYGDIGYYNQGNKLFEKKNYFEASQCYEKYLESEKKKRPRAQPFAVEKKMKGKANLNPHEETVYHLAECYLKIHDYGKAEKWYKQATLFSSKAYPACKYWYGVALRANQKYDEAIAAITDFVQHYTIMDQLLMDADRELDNLRFIQSQLNKNNKDRFVLVPQRNDEHTSDYAMSMQHGDTLMFTAIHATQGTGKDAADNYNNDLYTAVAADSVIGKSTLIRMPDLPGMQNGLSSFTPDGNIMFFTRWTKKDGKTNSAIYYCYMKDGSWSDPVKLSAPLNIDGYNSTQPFITDNGYLLFSSDRPGGVGNYDLWYAQLDSNFQAYGVANMGNVINTPGDEESPFYHQKTATLVFASNGRTGMGGFDIYYVRNELNFTKFAQPSNPGAPVNSPKDDLYFISTDQDNLWNTGWLSSDRSASCCLELFYVRENNKQVVSGSVMDCSNKKPLAGVKLNVTDPKHAGRQIAQYTTDSLGRYNFDLKNISRFQVTAAMDGYVSQDNGYVVHMESLVDTMNNDVICLSPVKTDVKEVLKSLSRSNQLGNFAYKKSTLPRGSLSNLDSLAALMKNNPLIKIQIEGYTDGIGGDAYNIKLSQARVNACIRYLVKKGIHASRLKGKAFGKCCPIEPEMIDGKDNPDAREKNRRVEYRLIGE